MSRKPAQQWKVWQKDCRTGEIRAADLSELYQSNRDISRIDVLALVNKWNELSAHDEADACLWMYWLED